METIGHDWGPLNIENWDLYVITTNGIARSDETCRKEKDVLFPKLRLENGEVVV